METYEWQKNKAIVDRLYYSERILEGSIITASFLTGFDVYFIYRNYFVKEATRRIPKYWIAAGAFSAVSLFVLLKPLKKEEIQRQWVKRKNMGKWLYDLYHLD